MINVYVMAWFENLIVSDLFFYSPNWVGLCHLWFWREFALSSFYYRWYFCWCFWCTFWFTRKHAFRAHIKLDNICK